MHFVFVGHSMCVTFSIVRRGLFKRTQQSIHHGKLEMTLNVTNANGEGIVANGAEITALITTLLRADGYGTAPIESFCLRAAAWTGEPTEEEEKSIVVYHLHGKTDEELGNAKGEPTEQEDPLFEQTLLELVRATGCDLESNDRFRISLVVDQTDGQTSTDYVGEKENGAFELHQILPPIITLVIGL